MLVSLPSSRFIESSHAPPSPSPGLRVVRPPGAGSCRKPLTAAQQGPANKRHPTSCVFETVGALPRVTTGWLLCCVVFVRAVLCLGRQRSPCQQHTATASPTSLLHPPLKKKPGTGNSSRPLPVALNPGQEVEAASQEERLAGRMINQPINQSASHQLLSLEIIRRAANLACCLQPPALGRNALCW